MEMSEAIKEAYAYAGNATTIYETVELTHTAFTEPICLVNSPLKLVTAMGEFSPVVFDASLPDTEGGVRGQLQIDIDFLPTKYRKLFYAVSRESESVLLYYRQYTSEGENAQPALELPVALSVSAFEFDQDKVTITALYPDLVNIAFCRRIMTTETLPGGRV